MRTDLPPFPCSDVGAVVVDPALFVLLVLVLTEEEEAAMMTVLYAMIPQLPYRPSVTFK